MRKLEDIMYDLVGRSYGSIGLSNINTVLNKFQCFQRSEQLPEQGWTSQEVNFLFTLLSMMDVNNHSTAMYGGEREGRLQQPLVANRVKYFSHGMGRSGELNSLQPKAPGSSAVAKLARFSALDLLKRGSGIKKLKDALILPFATGMSINFCIRFLIHKKQQSDYLSFNTNNYTASSKNGKFKLLWSRIDQYSAFKCMVDPCVDSIDVIPQKLCDDGNYKTDLEEFERLLATDEYVGIVSTTSCFAPRSPDSIKELSAIAKKFNVFHVINNAYGCTSTTISKDLNLSEYDYVIQSLDKNFLVPVGGAIVASPNKSLIQELSNFYAGRASLEPSMNFLETWLTEGLNEYKNLIQLRHDAFQVMHALMSSFDKIEVIKSEKNDISIAFKIKELETKRYAEFGSKLYSRKISGIKAVSVNKTHDVYIGNIIENVQDLKNVTKEKGWGYHGLPLQDSYFVLGVGMGSTPLQQETLFKKLVTIINQEMNKK